MSQSDKLTKGCDEALTPQEKIQMTLLLHLHGGARFALLAVWEQVAWLALYSVVMATNAIINIGPAVDGALSISMRHDHHNFNEIWKNWSRGMLSFFILRVVWQKHVGNMFSHQGAVLNSKKIKMLTDNAWQQEVVCDFRAVWPQSVWTSTGNLVKLLITWF